MRTKPPSSGVGPGRVERRNGDHERRAVGPERVERRNGNQRGLTLLEILIVMGIMAGVIGTVAPRFVGLKSNAQSAVRKLGSLTRQLQTTAKLKGQNFRLVFRNSEKDGVTYWVESGSLQAVPVSGELMERLGSLSEEEKQNILARNAYSKDTSVLKGEVQLPNGLKLLGIDTPSGAVTGVNNEWAVYFFGGGLAQEVAIRIGDGDKLYWTLMVEPLTGRSHVFQRKAEFSEFR